MPLVLVDVVLRKENAFLSKMILGRNVSLKMDVKVNLDIVPL